MGTRADSKVGGKGRRGMAGVCLKNEPVRNVRSRLRESPKGNNNNINAVDVNDVQRCVNKSRHAVIPIPRSNSPRLPVEETKKSNRVADE